METAVINNNLTFPEIVILLALNDKGWFGKSEQRIKFGLAGSILFELSEMGRVLIQDNKVSVINSLETGDKVYDSVIEVLSKSKRQHTLKNAILRIVYKSGLKWKVVVKNLISKGILRKEEYRFLKVFTQNKFPLVNPDVKHQITLDLYNKLTGNSPLTLHDVMLIAIMRVCRMIDKNFPMGEHYLKAHLKIREVTEFKDPLSDSNTKIKLIRDGIYKAYRTSNVNLHI